MPASSGRPLPRARAPRDDLTGTEQQDPDGHGRGRRDVGHQDVGHQDVGADVAATAERSGVAAPAPGRRRSGARTDRTPVPVRARAGRARGTTVEETSAGGLVVREADGVAQVALIARINRAGRLEWCLPKGHLEGEETPVEAAVREIAEETGIVGDPVRPLGTIDYWFTAEGRRIHKTVHHFLLRATGGRLGVEGDPDAEAVEAAWVPAPELERRLAFPNERRIARAAGDLLGDGG